MGSCCAKSPTNQANVSKPEEKSIPKDQPKNTPSEEEGKKRTSEEKRKTSFFEKKLAITTKLESFSEVAERASPML